MSIEFASGSNGAPDVVGAARTVVECAVSRWYWKQDASWIAHAGSIYRLTGIVSEGYGAEDRRIFGAVGQSFAALSTVQRAGIRESRLRVRQAHAGESLADLSRRTGNRWSLEETAIANGVPADAALSAGQSIKVAIQQPYQPR